MSSTGQSCGTTGFMEIFDLVADVITRNNVRKGAIKVDLDVWHPDILDFIKCKDNTDNLNKMNISVMVSDEFMEAVENNEEWELKFPDYENNKELYDEEWNGHIKDWEEKGYPIKVYETVKARELYHEMMEHAHKTGEPGVSFKDLMNKDNPNPHLGRISGTNPCSEFNSIPYNSCNLGSINLYNMVKNNEFDWDKFRKTIKTAVRYIDDMISVNELPLPKIEEVTKSTRPIGLGVMGYADMLASLGIPYNSKKAIKFTDELLDYFLREAILESHRLAEEKGVYPKWEGSVWEQKGIKMRNCSLLSIAPTGSISFIAGVSSGLEPNFALAYYRYTNEGDKYLCISPSFEQALKDRGLYSEELIEKVIDNDGSVQGLDEIPKDMQKVFVNANEMTPKEHLDILEVFYKYIDLSASKTINLPSEATIEDIENIYIDAWKRGIKCTTVYRDKSREEQTLRTSDKDEETSDTLKRGDVVEAQKRANSVRYKLNTGCGSLYLHIVYNDEGKIIETFTETKNGGCKSSTEGLSRMTSLALRSGSPIEEVIDQLKSVSPCISYCTSKARGENVEPASSCPHLVGKKLENFINKNKKDTKNIKTTIKVNEDNETIEFNDEEKCPECGAKLRHESGCVTCKCGWSKCS